MATEQTQSNEPTQPIESFRSNEPTRPNEPPQSIEATQFDEEYCEYIDLFIFWEQCEHVITNRVHWRSWGLLDPRRTNRVILKGVCHCCRSGHEGYGLPEQRIPRPYEDEEEDDDDEKDDEEDEEDDVSIKQEEEDDDVCIKQEDLSEDELAQDEDDEMEDDDPSQDPSQDLSEDPQGEEEEVDRNGWRETVSYTYSVSRPWRE